MSGIHRNSIVTVFVILVLMTGLTGCGDSPEPDTEPAPAEETTELEEELEEEEEPEEDPKDDPEDDPVDPADDPEDTEDERNHDDITEIEAHFIDVGQGDAILVEAGNVNILIDAGVRAAGEVVVEYLVNRGIRELDIVIATHPHADHIGGLIDVLAEFKVHRIIDSGKPHTTITYDDYLTQVEKQVNAGHCTYETPEDQVIPLGGNAELSVLGPDRDLGSLNDNSVVCRLDFQDVAFLFTGDAETAAEERLLKRDVNLAADILKAGHHGSRTSTTQSFLDAVSPTYAVIQAGEDNRYGHPHDAVLRRLNDAGVEIFRNDKQGTVVFTTDGESISVDGDPWEYTAEEQVDPDPEDETEEAAVGSVNINSASLEELQGIVHIGEARAQEIKEERPFDSLDDLTRVTGIGPSRLKDIRDEGIAYVD